MTPVLNSRLLIFLCHFCTLLLVRSIIEDDVQRLENEFVNDNCEGDGVLYVSPSNNFDGALDVSDAIKDSWSGFWKVANDCFEERLVQDEDLSPLSSKMFFVYEGNHCFMAWWRHINKYHGSDADWHLSVDCILLDACGQNGVLLNAMNDINK